MSTVINKQTLIKRNEEYSFKNKIWYNLFASAFDNVYNFGYYNNENCKK